MSTRRPSNDSSRSTEPSGSKKGSQARRTRAARPDEKEELRVEPAVPAREPREPREPPVVRDSPQISVPHIEISPDQRRAMVAEAAYLRAERRGFVNGNEVEDWLAAEAEVDKLLESTHSTRPQ
jgi:hypothetical protein